MHNGGSESEPVAAKSHDLVIDLGLAPFVNVVDVGREAIVATVGRPAK